MLMEFDVTATTSAPVRRSIKRIPQSTKGLLKKIYLEVKVMRIIDPHLHLNMMRGKDLDALAIAGVEAAVLPIPHIMPWMQSAANLIKMWDNFVEFQVKHPASLGIHVRVLLGIPFYGMAEEAVEECLQKLPEYLQHPNVCGVGEIGMDAGIEVEERLFRVHLQIAKEANLPVVCHTPTPKEPQAQTVLDQIIRVIHEEGFPIDRAVLDHSGKNTIKTRIAEMDARIGLSLCYDKLRPEDAAEIVRDFPEARDRIFINSEFGNSGEGYFSVPRAVRDMRMVGVSRDVIDQVVWDNPKKFFNLDVN